jgi:hypothetical protein
MTQFATASRVLSSPEDEMRTALALGIASAVVDIAGAETPSSVGSRVRSNSPAIVAAITTATEQSPTFRALTDTINASDGIVYFEEGRCGHGVRACLAAVKPAGANRVLRIRVGKYPSALSLMTAIGHELRHAIEVLSNRDIRSTEAMQQFYLRQGSRGPGGAIETYAAEVAGEAVRAELRDHQKERTPR